MKWYFKAFRQYFDFSGRARRKEYWMFQLFNLIVAVVATIIDSVTTGIYSTSLDGNNGHTIFGFVYAIYILATIIPGLSVTVRRLHDVGKSGWMILIAFIPLIGTIWLIVLLCTDSESGPNKWGANPKEPPGDVFEFEQA